MYSTAVAYLLWLVSGFGALGLHRFYLGKPLSGILYIFTGGLFMLGSFYDFFTLPGQVEEANLRHDYRRLMEKERREKMDYDAPPARNRFREEFRREAGKDSPEKVILKTAKKNNGVATPAEVALEGDISLDDAKLQLDSLASRGHAEVKITRAGLMVYVFPEFVTDPSRLDLEDL